MIAIIDYDAGNIKSVEKALVSLGGEVVITRDPAVLKRADHVILPGVGSFGDCMEKLNRYELVEVIKEVAASGTPFLGICLGQQLLFEDSEETPGVPGLGILKGHVLRFDGDKGLKIPQIGWNFLTFCHDKRLFEGIEDGAYVYFVHSFYVKAEDETVVSAVSEYANTMHASVAKGNIFACQFHPEKSGRVGLQILKNFLSLKKEAPVC
ncbi:MAG: imidazole glycerol phosphate synthase subunit HisH [Lachnospiraceae bacterium]|nr:imidazole glycerol phosphate synthase subunit HisH [Lachnospiraceae bacterium]